MTNLTKRFGTLTAVDNISFKVEKGQIFGLLGPNGAGKTTTLRMLATIFRPTSGTASVGGYDILAQPEKVRSIIGVVSENPGLYDRLTCSETVLYYGRLYGMPKEKLRERMKYIFKMLEIEQFADRKTEKLSKGEKQKVILARAIIHDPPVLMLDEPTSGLDVLSARTILEFLKKCRARDKTILLSTHIMPIAEEICDHLAIIHRGKILTTGRLDCVLREGEDLESAIIRLVKG